MKKCSFCQEEIQDSAIKCRFCGEFLEEKRPEDEKGRLKIENNKKVQEKKIIMNSGQQKFLLFITTYSAILLVTIFEGITISPALAGEILGSTILLPLIVGKWLKAKGKYQNFTECSIFFISILISFFVGFNPQWINQENKYEFVLLILIFTSLFFFPLKYLFSKIIKNMELKKSLHKK